MLEFHMGKGQKRLVNLKQTIIHEKDNRTDGIYKVFYKVKQMALQANNYFPDANKLSFGLFMTRYEPRTLQFECNKMQGWF